jgi:hypothetical protein
MPRYMLLTKHDDNIGAGPMSEWDPDDITAHLEFTTLGERRRVTLMGVAILGYVALVVVSLIQTAAGMAPLDVGVVAAVLYLLGVGLLGVAFLTALRTFRKPLPRAHEGH